MNFLSVEELKDAIYEYQLQDITQNDDTIAENAINAAIDEVKSYLTFNNKLEEYDGRIHYDVAAIFSAEGKNRNALILAHTKTIAKWWIILLSNVDEIYEQVKDRYDRSIDYLTKVAKGTVTLAGVPILTDDPVPDDFASGSRRKFRHEESPILYPFNPAIDTAVYTNIKPV